MNDCFLISTGSTLPGEAVPNGQIQDYLGMLEGEDAVMERVLKMNGIRLRHYAQDRQQRPTESVYSMAAEAVRRCVNGTATPSYLAAGSTYAPLSGPGLSTMVHDLLRGECLDRAIEISSHAGICTSGAAALASAVRAVRCGDHACAVAVGSDHSSEVLKSDVIRPVDDRRQHDDIRRSRWFMSVFLRFMLSDGAGAILLQDRPADDRMSFRVDWLHSRSYAHQTELCMKLENRSGLLSQDVSILSRHLIPSTESFLRDAFRCHGESIDDYDIVLPHLSSFFFRRRTEKLMGSLSEDGNRVIPYWTNLETAGNTGSASIFIMLDEYLASGKLREGQRLLLFVPESGQFNFVLVSLTAVLP